MTNYLIKNIGQLLLMRGEISTYGKTSEELLGLIEGAALAIQDGVFAWYGPDKEVPAKFSRYRAVDAQRGVVMPGLIDSHTHAVFAGSREHEYELRSSGISYTEIARRGGGIKYTVEQTRKASFDQLYSETKARLLRMMEFGVSTIEIKSGYGLDLETEIRQLEVVQKLGKDLPLTIVPTYLGAHEIPAPHTNKSYVDFLVSEAIPEIAERGLAEYCDVFCETGVFTVVESREVLEKARSCGLKLKLHAEELSSIGGAELSAELGATSADHLLCISEAGIKSMIEAKVVAGLLPGTALFLGKKGYAPARKIIDAGGTVALATDCNPGSCTCENLLLITTLGCSQLAMTPAESLWAVTKGGAYALNRADTVGQITIGGRADVALFDAPNFQYIPYACGRNTLQKLFIAGEIIVDRDTLPSQLWQKHPTV